MNTNPKTNSHIGTYVSIDIETTAETAIARPPTEEVRLWDVHAVAKFLSCSARHVYRLADSGRMPRPRKLGALVRWDCRELEKWLADGCPKCV